MKKLFFHPPTSDARPATVAIGRARIDSECLEGGYGGHRWGALALGLRFGVRGTGCLFEGRRGEERTPAARQPPPPQTTGRLAGRPCPPPQLRGCGTGCAALTRNTRQWGNQCKCSFTCVLCPTCRYCRPSHRNLPLVSLPWLLPGGTRHSQLLPARPRACSEADETGLIGTIITRLLPQFSSFSCISFAIY